MPGAGRMCAGWLFSGGRRPVSARSLSWLCFLLCLRVHRDSGQPTGHGVRGHTKCTGPSATQGHTKLLRSLTLHPSLAFRHRGEGAAVAISNACISGLPVSQTGAQRLRGRLSLEPRDRCPDWRPTPLPSPAPPGGRVNPSPGITSCHVPLPPSSPRRWLRACVCRQGRC